MLQRERERQKLQTRAAEREALQVSTPYTLNIGTLSKGPTVLKTPTAEREALQVSSHPYALSPKP